MKLTFFKTIRNQHEYKEYTIIYSVSVYNCAKICCFFIDCLQMDITPGPDGRFGFTIVGDCPLLVEDCSPCSPAGRSGLRAGDYVMEVNGIPVKHHEMAAALIKASQGRTLRLGVLCMGSRQKRSSGSLEISQNDTDGMRQDRKHKALEFNKRVSLSDRL